MATGYNIIHPKDFWMPFEHKIGNFDELLKVINTMATKAAAGGRQFAWRGQVNADWALHSSLFRRVLKANGHNVKLVHEKELQTREQKILAELHRWGLHQPQGQGRLSILQQLATLQHFGAPTRLIDISFNAWIGVWFAVEAQWQDGNQLPDSDDARLFAVDVTSRLINESDKRDWEDELSRPWKIGSKKIAAKTWTSETFAWKPSALNNRIFAQNGGFLLAGVPAASTGGPKPFQFPRGNNQPPWKIEEGKQACCLPLRQHKFYHSKGSSTNGALYTFRIAASAKAEIRQRLEKIFGYNHSVIYPDFSGFALHGTLDLPR